MLPRCMASVKPGPVIMEKQVRATRDGHLIIIPECGHYVPLEKPVALNGILRSLIDELQGSA
ncbi:alpha/beta fold hydrolase [Mesorhizobium sp. NPDC059054]|uniref:alpha/beta fold hydrolase n=1 Tax=Mesorhizobium sp. NPDC059054 TaxID=3346711 RepID=UPI003691B84D